MIYGDFDIKSIDRVIAHKIYPKTAKNDAEAETSSALLNFDDKDKTTLINRVVNALNNSSKTFNLEFEDKSESSVYTLLENHSELQDDDRFIDVSCSLADKLAEAHFRVKIPGGYCLVVDGRTSNNDYFFLIIKAELQEVFNINQNQLQLIKDVFLSPAKDFYKIGYFLKNNNGTFTPFMYDDLFSSQKRDLTEYFYSAFLGLTSDKNDALKTKNFFYETKDFIDNNISEPKDRFGMQKALRVYLREDMNGTISAKDFSDTYLFGFDEPKKKYDKQIVERQFPRSFTKNMRNLNLAATVDLQRVSIGRNITLVGKDEFIDDLQVLDNPTIQSIQETLQPMINTGRAVKAIFIQGQPIVNEDPENFR